MGGRALRVNEAQDRPPGSGGRGPGGGGGGRAGVAAVAAAAAAGTDPLVPDSHSGTLKNYEPCVPQCGAQVFAVPAED